MPRLKIPDNVNLNVDVHTKWMQLFEQAEKLINEDADLQKKAAKGLRLKERRLPVEVLGRMYAQYCDLINRMHDTYLNNVHLQRARYMREIIALCVKRMYELRNELVHFIVNDYLYVDMPLAQLRMTPFDSQIVVPYHIPLESRAEAAEELLMKMWAESSKRLKKPPKITAEDSPKIVPVEPDEGDDHGLTRPPPEPEPDEVEEEEESIVESVHTILSEDHINAVLIQKHERFRTYFIAAYKNYCGNRKTYFTKHVVPAPLEMREKAARYVQKFYREYMRLKRKKVRDDKRDMLIGLIPDVERRPLSFQEENDKMYERRRQTRKEIENVFQKQKEDELAKLIYRKKEDTIDDICVQIRVWFFDWYYGYEFFPQYPYAEEGGTLMVIRGQYQTIEEQEEQDEIYKRKTKGKTKEQLKEEKEKAKEEAIMKAQLAKELAKKEAENLFKARCNPPSDPGYEPKQSEFMESMLETLRRYRQAWSLYDVYPPDKCRDVIYGYMEPVLIEDLMNDMHIELRKYVDELMRSAMYKRVNWTYPKLRPRKKPEATPEPKPFIIDDKLLKSLEAIFDLGIMSRPKTRLSDVFGDFKYAAYELNVADPDVKFPSPGYGDVRLRLVLSCVFGSGVEPGAPRNRGVMLLGPPRNGKAFLVDAICGELNAVKFDISPEIFSSKVKRPAKLLNLIFLAARVFQPCVIYLKDVERVFCKKVPPDAKWLKAKTVKAPLTKLVKSIPLTEKMIFIATCSYPQLAAAKPMCGIFSELIVVPRTDYGTLQRFFYDNLQRIRSIPRDYNVHGLAQTMQGIGFGTIIQMFKEVMTPERIVRLNVDQLEQSEFLEYLIEKEIERMPLEEYMKNYVDFYVQNSPLKNERKEYEIINATRAYVYMKLKKKEDEDAAKAEAAKAK